MDDSTKAEKNNKEKQSRKMIKRFDEECLFASCSKQYLYKVLNKSCSYQIDSG